jgi:restriction system protein
MITIELRPENTQNKKTMKKYNRVMAGAKSVYAPECFQNGYIGIHGLNTHDLTGKLPERWKDFNSVYRPIYLQDFPDKTKIAAGLACGMIWTLSQGLRTGDIIITPDGSGRYRAGEITGDYHWVSGDSLPHRRPVNWFPDPFDRADMSDLLKRSTNSTGTCCEISQYHEELDLLIGGQTIPDLIATDETIEDPSAFALEKHLEDFLISNWASTQLAAEYDIFTEDGEIVGQQYPSDTGPLDILAISKDKKTLLVVELKKGRASDNVVGQIQRYMGFVQEELAEEGQTVKGVIIALENDLRIRRALKVAPNIDFYRYQISFTLQKGN